MTIRSQSLHEARCIDVTDSLIDLLDLGWLKITHAFDPRNTDTDRILCEAKADWEYRQCTLTWNLHQVASTTDDDLNAVAVHELIHALNAPVWESLTASQQDKLAKLNELATENVARVISKLLELIACLSQ